MTAPSRPDSVHLNTHPQGTTQGRAVDLEIVIPAFNERERLPATLMALTECLSAIPLRCAVLVVDNGSTDGTPELVRSWAGGQVPIRLMGCSRQGKGAAVRRGMTSSSARWIGFCDADLATSFDALEAVVAELVGGADVVIGSRRVARARLLTQHGPVRRAGSRCFRALVKHLVPGVTDTQCGFKFFRGDVARELFAVCRCDGFAFDVELLALAARQGRTIQEVPVSWTAQEGSTFSVLHHGRAAARELLTIRSTLRAEPASAPLDLRERSAA